MKLSLIRFIPFGLIITFAAFIAFGTGQYILRQSANDPQVQIAQDAAVALAIITAPPQLPPQKVDMVKSLAPYLVLYNDKGKAVLGNVQLDGKIPVPPKGVFDYVRSHKRDDVTWEPRAGVRQAAVVVRVEGERPGFVLAGRSLRETEKRIQDLLTRVIFVYILALFVTFVATVLVTARPEQTKPRKRIKSSKI